MCILMIVRRLNSGYDIFIYGKSSARYETINTFVKSNAIYVFINTLKIYTL